MRGVVAAGRAVSAAADWVFGASALTLGLAVLAALPVAQFLVFGYLLEGGGRVARTGRLRDGLIGVNKAARLGRMGVAVLLCWLPLRLIASLADSAELVDPGGRTALGWRVGLALASALAVVHLAAACARGGRFRDLLVPFRGVRWCVRRVARGGSYARSRDAVWGFLAGLRLPHYFRLGVVGAVGTTAWLALPVTLMAGGRRHPLAMAAGAILLGVVALPLPFLQVQYAAEGRFRALFEYRAVRRRFRKTPWAFALAAASTLLSAVPLYLFKIEMIPREAIWLPSLIYLGFIVPARLATAWAYGRSDRPEVDRHGFWRWTGRLALAPVAGFYVLAVFLSQYTAWRGVLGLYEQHAFLLPVPFIGL